MGGFGEAAATGGATASRLSLRPRQRRTTSWADRSFHWLAVLPTAVITLLVFGLPLLFSAWLSVEGWQQDQTLFGGRFVGWENYAFLLTDPNFLGSLRLTLVYTAVTVAAELAGGLGIALLLNIDLKGIGLFRTLLVVPMMITPVVAASCWKLLLDPAHGAINAFIGQHIIWLGQPGTALLSVSVVNVWQSTPYVAILLLAGLRSLPHEPLEAASIDGASHWQVFRHITLPLLKPYILVALLLRMIFEFRAFDNIYVLTGGGPANATMTLSMFTYIASFGQFDMSLGAASSWVMLAISLLMCLFFMALVRRRDAS
jgi:multiple sugar transport system permease protein